ncbi:Muscle protein 20 [Carabus blaptoides fortunei]
MSLERQVRAKLAGKRSPEQEKEAQEWIETILGKKFPNGELYEDVIRDGTVLCELMNKLVPGSIPKVNTSGGQFKMMENINNFQAALKNYGVDDIDVFQTVDLWEKKDIGQVTCTLFSLGRATYKHPEFKGPWLGPKPSDECKRDFSEEQLKAGQTIIGLQAGSNKGATQAGQNMGAGRKILLGNDHVPVTHATNKNRSLSNRLFLADGRSVPRRQCKVGQGAPTYVHDAPSKLVVSDRKASPTISSPISGASVPFSLPNDTDKAEQVKQNAFQAH